MHIFVKIKEFNNCIMIQLKVKKLLKLRGIDKPMKFLLENGFTYSVAYSIYNLRCNSISLNNVEKLCVALSCTPNDLLEYLPSKDSPLPDSHPLNKLKHADTFNLFDITKDIPNYKIPELKSAIEEVKSKILNSPK